VGYATFPDYLPANLISVTFLFDGAGARAVINLEGDITLPTAPYSQPGLYLDSHTFSDGSDVDFGAGDDNITVDIPLMEFGIPGVVQISGATWDLVAATAGSEGDPLATRAIALGYVLCPPVAAQQLIIENLLDGRFGNNLYIECMSIYAANPCASNLPYSWNANDFAALESHPDCWIGNIAASADPVNGHKYMNLEASVFTRPFVYKDLDHNPFDGTEFVNFTLFYYAGGDFEVRILDPGNSEIVSHLVTNTSGPGAAATTSGTMAINVSCAYIKLEVDCTTMYEYTLEVA
jgi:hypothetical protein